MVPRLQPRPLHESVAALLGDASAARVIDAGDSRSGAGLQRFDLDGESVVLKTFDPAHDWLMRVAGDTDCWNIRAWESGLMDAVPSSIDHATIGASLTRGEEGVTGALLMRDVAAWVVPDGDSMLDADLQLQILDRMAELHATFWGWRDGIGLMPLERRYLFLSPAMARRELEIDPEGVIPPLVLDGWDRLASAAPGAAAVIVPLLEDVAPFVHAVRETPLTLLHGDWKATNVGSAPDGRTVLLDWAFPGSGPACSDLSWSLAINVARNPLGHEATIAAYREALERHGIATEPWWDRQLALALLGSMLQFGWEKALGGGDEFGWWMDRVTEGAVWLSG
ncbi:MAG TPA: aminoglycoside phosphotransferase [Acidimicrobiia bacterium]|nr:aminoglycoside phosphotransferase [Acidimicrobiia bacterium]